jgi:hypothetical protein
LAAVSSAAASCGITALATVTAVADLQAATRYTIASRSSRTSIAAGGTSSPRPSFPALAPIGDEDVLVGIAVNNVNIYVACILTSTSRPTRATIWCYGSRSTLSPGGAVVALISGA